VTEEEFFANVKPFLPDIHQVGWQWKATCPFCKKHSFYLYRDAHFHCFDCGTAGDYTDDPDEPLEVTHPARNDNFLEECDRAIYEKAKRECDYEMMHLYDPIHRSFDRINEKLDECLWLLMHYRWQVDNRDYPHP